MRPLALKCAESGCMQAVALLGRLGPVFPAARRREPTYEGECVFPAPRGERSERSVLLWMSEIRSKESHRYRLLPFKSLSSRPSQELGGCLNEVKAGGFSNGLTPRLCKIPIHNCAPSGAHLPEPRNLENGKIGACRGEAYSRIPNLSQLTLTDK